MQDWCLLTVPRSVAITNPRLNVLFYVLFLAMFGVCCRNFIEAKQWSGKIQVHTRTLIEFSAESGATTEMLNITGHSKCPPNKTVEDAETLLSAWSNLSVSDRIQRAEALWAPVHLLQGSPPLLEASSTCLPMCSGKADPTRCYSPLTFMDQRHGSHVAVWSAKHVLRSDGPFVHSYVGPSVASTPLVIKYSYELEEAVPSLAELAFKPPSSGDHTTANTVLINSKGVPGKRFPFGSEVKLTLSKLLKNAKDLPQQLLQGTEPAWEVFRDGLELKVEVQCYNDDVELFSRAAVYESTDTADWKLGATSKSPVCLLQVKFVRCCSAFAAAEVTTQGNVVMNRALMVQSSTGTTVMWFPSFSRLLLSLTSILVLLQLPLKAVRWFTLTCLGQLSRLYKRVIVQHFDIQQEAATMAVNLMSNSVSFLELTDCATGKHSYPAISRARMEERLRAALQQRRDVLSDAELSAFVSCCFESMLTGGGDKLDLNKELTTAATAGIRMTTTPTSFQAGGVEPEVEDDIIDIDTFNVHCSTSQAVDLQAAVELFDQDRYRWPLEWLFTPRRLQQALRKVKQASKLDRQETLEHIDVFEDMQVQHAISALDLEEQGINILRQQTGIVSAKPSLEERKNAHDDQRHNFQHLCTVVRDLLQRDRHREQAMKLQANEIEKLRDSTKNLEAELHEAEVTLESMTKTQKGEQKEGWVQQVEKNLLERISELERSVDNRLSRALSNNGLLSREATGQSNPGVDPQTLSEQAVRLGELTDRLAMLEAELKHNSLAAKEACELLAEQLQDAKQVRHSSESRLANLEATVRMQPLPEPHRSGKPTRDSQERSAHRGQQGVFEEVGTFAASAKAGPSRPRLQPPEATATSSHFPQRHQSQGIRRDCARALSGRSNSRECF